MISPDAVTELACGEIISGGAALPSKPCLHLPPPPQYTRGNKLLAQVTIKTIELTWRCSDQTAPTTAPRPSSWPGPPRAAPTRTPPCSGWRTCAPAIMGVVSISQVFMSKLETRKDHAKIDSMKASRLNFQWQRPLVTEITCWFVAEHLGYVKPIKSQLPSELNGSCV